MNKCSQEHGSESSTLEGEPFKSPTCFLNKYLTLLHSIHSPESPSVMDPTVYQALLGELFLVQP